MTIRQLLSGLFNLGAQTDFWNSTPAARLFWLSFAAAVVIAVGYLALGALRHRRRRGQPFGHSLHS
jgi:hypothetical protein